MVVDISCRSNLDLRTEDWPIELPGMPVVGQKIQSKTKWGPNKIQLELEVVETTWRYLALANQWYLSVELHLPKHSFESILAFHAWYKDILREQQ